MSPWINFGSKKLASHSSETIREERKQLFFAGNNTLKIKDSGFAFWVRDGSEESRLAGDEQQGVLQNHIGDQKC